MTEAKHTPGPWEHVAAERLSHDAPEQGPKLTEGGVLGGTEDDPVWVIEGEIEFAPDARLIEAAPDMLVALKVVRALMTVNSIVPYDSLHHWEKEARDKITQEASKRIDAAIAKATGAE